MLTKTLTIVFIIFLFAIQVKCDVLKHFDDSTSTYFLNEKNIELQGERFTLEQPIILNNIRLKVLGAKGKTGKVLLFGNEGGNPLPIYESELVSSLEFEKSIDGIEWVTLDLDDLIINETQIFVCVSMEVGELITSKEEIAAECYSSNCSDFRYQVIKKDGNWVSGLGTYLIELDYKLLNSNDDYLFSEFEIKDESVLNQGIKSVGVFDLNKDNLLDVVTNKGVFLNKNSHFESISYSNDTVGIYRSIVFYSADLDKHLLLNLSLDSNYHSKIYEPKFENNKFELTLLNEQRTIFNNITSFSIFENKFTNQQSILVVDNKLDRSQLFLFGIQNDFSLVLLDSAEVDFKLNTLSIIGQELNKQLLLTAKTGEILYFTINEQTVNFKKIVSLEPEYLLGTINLIDINNDNYNDTVYTIQNMKTSLENKTNILFKRNNSNSSYPVLDYNDEYVDIKKIDLDNDAENDLILFTDCECRESKIFSKNINSYSDITYQAGVEFKSLGPSAVVADFNNDGKLDLTSILNEHLKIYNNKSTSSGNSVAFLSDTKIKQIETYTNSEKRISYPASNNNYLFQNPNFVHIGIGNDLIDSAFAVNEKGRYRIDDFKINYNNFISDKNNVVYLETQEQVSTFPNPFKNSIQFNISIENMNSVSILIYNIEGNVVFEDILNYSDSKQMYLWNGLDMNGISVPSGVYSYLIVSGKQKVEGKIIKID